jgi:hypothetical protein
MSVAAREPEAHGLLCAEFWVWQQVVVFGDTASGRRGQPACAPAAINIRVHEQTKVAEVHSGFELTLHTGVGADYWPQRGQTGLGSCVLNSGCNSKLSCGRLPRNAAGVSCVPAATAWNQHHKYACRTLLDAGQSIL